MTQIVISVQCGLIPGQAMDEHTRLWAVEHDTTAEQYADILKAADGYVASMRDPALLNWVRMEWIYL